MQGALTLTQIRGSQQLKDGEAGLELFLHLRAQIVSQAVSRRQRYSNKRLVNCQPPKDGRNTKFCKEIDL